MYEGEIVFENKMPEIINTNFVCKVCSNKMFLKRVDERGIGNMYIVACDGGCEKNARFNKDM